jgi:hypothetical protein
MVDRSLRRAAKRASESAPVVLDTVHGDEPVTDSEPRAEPVIDRIAVADDSGTPVERDESKRIGVVEVEPDKLGEYVAGRGNDSGSGDGSGTRKRRADSGKPRGTRKNKEVPQNVEALVSMVHTWASVLLKTPELNLAPNEVKQLSDAYVVFSQHHTVPILTEKRMSEVNLIATALMLYGSRFVAIRNRHKEEKRIHVVNGVPQAANVNRHPVM